MESAGSDIKKYLKLLYKRRYIFILTFFLVVTTAVVYSYRLPEVYEAKCTVFIERNVIENLISGVAITPSMEDRLDVLSYAMKSRKLLLKVVNDLGMGSTPEQQAETEALVNKFQRNTDITTRGGRNDMNLFIISYRDEDPRLARDYTNTLVRRYIEESVSEKREEAYGANRFLAQEIKYFKEKLDNHEAEIVNFRREKGIFVATDERKIVDEISNHQEQLEELKIQQMELEARLNMIKEQIKDEKPYTVAIMGRRNEDPKTRLLFLQNKLNELLTRYTENYPEVIRVKAEMESLKAHLNEKSSDLDSDVPQRGETEMTTLNPVHQRLKEDLSETKLSLAAIKTRKENLKKLIESKQSHLREIPEEKKKLKDMERERDTYNSIYEQLVQRLGQSEVSKQMEIQDKTATFRIVDPATMPSKPVSPDRVKIILLGLFAGLGGGLGSVMLLDNMDRSVKNVDSLREFGLPVLAVIPRIQNDEDLKKRRLKDILVYCLSGIYFLCILGIMAVEFMGIEFLNLI